MGNIEENYLAVRQRIKAICLRYGINEDEINVLAATKYADGKVINETIRAGVRIIGENRIQDAEKKFPLVIGDIRKHFIGRLQSNKVKKAVMLFDCIESVDNEKLLLKINEEAQGIKKVMDVLIQVNIGVEIQKGGLSEDELVSLLDRAKDLQYIRVRGLMAVMPNIGDEAILKGCFKQMAGIFKRYSNFFVEMPILSMGMSNDFEIAVECGANEVRIGSLLFK